MEARGLQRSRELTCSERREVVDDHELESLAAGPSAGGRDTVCVQNRFEGCKVDRNRGEGADEKVSERCSSDDDTGDGTLLG